ncbi:MAG: type II secretion system protein GspG [Candidatus Auribacterota bacterium]|jgi:prepilin-type N-terminal cleavage/methylation domain-containing protein|nr:type II secretion system protein GspG [Candidatus Auribacterota bacterium]
MRGRQKGFTLIELMVSVAIMVVLAGIALPTMMFHYKKAKVTKATAQISRLESAIDQFKNDMGYYPPALTAGEYFGDSATERGKRKEIIEALSGFDINKNRIALYWDDPDWNGPYLECKGNELDTNGQMLDPWLQPFLFDATPSGRVLKNTDTVDIISKGADKQWDSANESSDKNDDNICNWQK